MNAVSTTVPERVKQAVQSIDANARVILFGSRARGDFHEESDWDFLVLLEQPVDWEFEKLIRRKIYQVELETEQAISTIVEYKEKWEMLQITPFYQNVTSEGITIEAA